MLIVDDVIIAGTATAKLSTSSTPLEAGLRMMIALHREEKGRGEPSAIQEVERDFSIGLHSIITLTDLISYLETQAGMQTSSTRCAKS